MCKANEGCCCAVYSFPSDIQMKGAAVLSTAFLPIFKFSGMHATVCKASSYRHFKRHSNTAGRASPLAISSQLYSRWALMPTVRYFCPFNYSRKLFITKTPPQFTEIRSQPSAVLTCGQTRRSEMAHLQLFLANAERCYRFPAGETTALRAVVPLTLFTAVSLYDRIFIRFSILSCACYIPRQPGLVFIT